MYNDTITVANKIITDKDLLEIFQMMNDDLEENIEIEKKETIENEKYESNYQHWTVKQFSGNYNCTFNFHDDTSIKVDNYSDLLEVFHNRQNEIKSMWILYSYSYWIKDGEKQDYISQRINLAIYENSMDINFDLSSEDEKMNNIYQLIKEKILKAPTRYSRIIRKRRFISNKMYLAFGLIPSLILCTLLLFVPAIKEIFSNFFILYPITVLLFGFLLGSLLLGSKLQGLYSTLIPNQKYERFDMNKNKSIYKDDTNEYLSKGEIIIGKNTKNIKKRKEIIRMEKKYNKYIPVELFILVIISIFVLFL